MGTLPLHPLVVHLAVALIPLAAVAAALFVLRPAWRWWLRLPTAVVAVLALAALFVTRASGDALAHTLTVKRDLIEAHDRLAGILTVATVPLVALALYACWAFASTSPLPSGRGERPHRGPRLDLVVTVLVVLLALAVLVLTVLSGHSGATAAWTS